MAQRSLEIHHPSGKKSLSLIIYSSISTNQSTTIRKSRKIHSILIRYQLQEVRDRNLPDKLIEMVKGMEESAGETECVKLLLCKLKPFIWSMQKAVINKIDQQQERNNDDNESKKKHNRKTILFKYLPDLSEFKNNGIECEDKYNSCKLF